MYREKTIIWIGSSYGDLKRFPKESLKELGFQLGRIQVGLDPDDWKPFEDVGPGTREIRVRDKAGAYRVMYVAKFEEAVYVLHCFVKKTRATARHDKDTAKARYRAVVRDRKNR